MNLLTVWVPHRCNKLHCWWVGWEISWEFHLCFEGASLRIIRVKIENQILLRKACHPNLGRLYSKGTSRYHSLIQLKQEGRHSAIALLQGRGGHASNVEDFTAKLPTFKLFSKN